jgi:hypothetical protein
MRSWCRGRSLFPAVEPAPQHVALGNIGREEDADEDGGEEGALTRRIGH